MKRHCVLGVCCTAIALFISGAHATCTKNGERVQTVWLSSGGAKIEHWEVKPEEIHRIRLKNGFELGLRIEPATADKYRELLNRLPGSSAVDELVKISVYEMTATEPRLLTYTWGGANSRQGYGPRGGAARVEAVGEPGIELWLHKAVCVKVEDLATLQ